MQHADQHHIASRLARVTQRPTAPVPVIPQHERPTWQVAELITPTGETVATVSCHPDLAMISIGRSRDAVIRLQDDDVSRFHGSLSWDQALGVHLLADCGSANGTYLNGRRIRGPVALLDGARLRLGTTELVYRRRHD